MPSLIQHKITKCSLSIFSIFFLLSCNHQKTDDLQEKSEKQSSILPISDQDQSQSPYSSPNIIVILTDDMGYKDVGFNGGIEIPTPNIDRIANEGVRFSQGYVSHPTCGPSRAGLLTGRYQARFGFYQNPNNDPRDPNSGIPLSEQLITNYIKPVGYRSIAIGKWHMGAHPSLRPQKRGFDEFFGFLSGSHHYFADKFEKLDVNKALKKRDLHKTWLRRGDTPVKTSGYITDLFSNEAVNFIDRQKQDENPFFIYLAYNAPHVPLEATQKYLDRFSHIKNKKRRTYAAMVSAVDDGVGQILDKLDQEGLSENTIIFFLSDNGGIVNDETAHPDFSHAPKRSRWNGSDNGDLRAGKGQVFEGGIRVPFAMRWPAKIKPGIDYPYPVISLDILATALGVNGIKPSVDQSIDGVNLIPHITNLDDKTLAQRTLFWRQIITVGKRRFATVTHHEKYITDERRDLVAFYDLETDISETNNIAQYNSTKLSHNQTKIKDWISAMPAGHVSTPSNIDWRPLEEK